MSNESSDLLLKNILIDTELSKLPWKLPPVTEQFQDVNKQSLNFYPWLNWGSIGGNNLSEFWFVS